MAGIAEAETGSVKVGKYESVKVGEDERPTHLDLFSGIGGFALAAEWAGFRTIGFCDIDRYCRKVLAKNFLADTEHAGLERCWQHEKPNGREADATSPRCQIWPDIFDLDGRQFAGVDLITGGFPCQPFSVAGKRGGAADDRAIWPQMFRIISEARPAWVLGENVPGIIPMELDNVLSDLEGIGYATRSFVIPACAVDARHRRDRLWVIGGNISNRTVEGLEGHRIAGNAGRTSEKGQHARETDCGNFITADAILPERSNDAGNELRGEKHAFTCIGGGDNGRTRPESGFCEWLPEPDVGRVAHGIPSRVDRLKGLGNAIVPQVAYEILREIRKLL